MDPHAELAVLGDPKGIRDVFARGIEAFAQGRLQLEGVAIRRFGALADGSPLLQYEVEIRDPDGGRTDRQIWVGEPRPRAQPGRSEPLHPPELGPPTHRLREPDLLFWVFPNDPVLECLPGLWDRRRFCAFIDARRDHFRLPKGTQVESVETQRIKYVGTERCTLRHALALSDGSCLVVYSKISENRAAARNSFEAMRAFHGALGAATLSVPEPFFWDPERGAVFAQGLEGANADERLDEIDLERAGGEMGAALAALHQCEVPGLPELDDRELLLRLPRARAALGALGDARGGARLEELCTLFAETASELPRLPRAPIHGAFRLSQLLITAEGLGLVDFDSCARGSPVFDVGSFVAYLLYLGHKGKLGPARGAACIRCFCRAYEKRAPWGLPPELLRWHVAGQLLTKHARRSARKKRDRERAVALLETAEAVLRGQLRLV